MTSSFSAFIADLIRKPVNDVLQMPVYSDMDAAHDDTQCVIVNTDDAEEIIPGNLTEKITFFIYIRLDPVQHTAAEMRSLEGDLQRAIVDTLNSLQRMQELDVYGCRATLLDCVYSEVLPVEADQPYYQSRMRARAYLQF